MRALPWFSLEGDVPSRAPRCAYQKFTLRPSLVVEFPIHSFSLSVAKSGETRLAVILPPSTSPPLVPTEPHALHLSGRGRLVCSPWGLLDFLLLPFRSVARNGLRRTFSSASFKRLSAPSAAS